MPSSNTPEVNIAILITRVEQLAVLTTELRDSVVTVNNKYATTQIEREKQISHIQDVIVSLREDIQKLETENPSIKDRVMIVDARLSALEKSIGVFSSLLSMKDEVSELKHKVGNLEKLVAVLSALLTGLAGKLLYDFISHLATL